MGLEIAGVVIGILVDHLFRQHRLKLDHRHVAELLEVAGLVQNVSHTTGHAGRTVAPDLAQHHYDAAGDVFAAVTAGALDHSHRARITHRKTYAGDAAEIAFALDRAVHHGIADDDGFLRHDAGIARRLDDDAAAGQALADIVVAFAFEIEGDAARQPGAERLARGALEGDLDGVMRQPAMAVDFRQRARQPRAGAAVGVVDLHLELDRRAAVDCGLRLFDQGAVEHGFQVMVLAL